MGKGPKYVPGEKWFAGSRCSIYNKGDILKILRVSGEGRGKTLIVTDANGNKSEISFKKLWKKVKTYRKKA